jgi:adenylate cyclase
MLQQGLDKPLIPRHTNITVLSADMQNYSGLTASGSLQETADLTRGFLQCITGPLLKHQGTLDKYTGDGLVAFWGAPLPTEEPANQAILAALEMVQTVYTWNLQRIAKGLPEARLRIGIESGLALVGDLGTPFRSTYTAVGTCINSASKIQAAAKHYSHDILVGDVVAPAITVVPLIKVGVIQWGETLRTKTVYAPQSNLSSCPSKVANISPSDL